MEDVKIIDARPMVDGAERIGTVYTVFVTQDDETELVEVYVQHDATTPILPVAPAPETPVDAYAAYIWLYLDWLDKNDKEKFDALHKSTYQAVWKHQKYNGDIGSFKAAEIRDPLDEDAPRKKTFVGSMYGKEFDEYVHETWLEFEADLQNTDADTYAEMLRKRFEWGVDKYCEKVVAEYAKTHDLSENYDLTDDMASLTEYVKEHWAENCKYPLSEFLLKKCSKRIMERERYKKAKQNKALKVLSIDDEENGLEYTLSSGAVLEEEILIKEELDERMENLGNGRLHEIAERKGQGFSQAEIAKMLGVTPAAISKAVKKIQNNP